MLNTIDFSCNKSISKLSLLRVENKDKDRKEFFQVINGQKIYLPRYFNVHNENTPREDFDKKIRVNIPNLFDEYKDNIRFTPRNDKQQETVNFLNSTSNGCLILSTGSGKTKCTINHIIKNNLKSIVLCHNTSIMDQWKKSFKDVIDIKDDEIYLVKGSYSKAKLKKAKVIIISNKTVSARLQSPSKRSEFLTDMFECNFDTTVIDEAHLNFEANNLWLMNIYTNNVYVLTATPFRSDRGENEIIKFIYPIHNKIEIIDYEQPVKVMFYSFNSNPNPKDIYYVCLSSKYKLDKNNYFKYLKRENNQEQYFLMIESLINDVRKKYGNHIKFLFTGLTIESLNALYDRFSNNPLNKIKRFYGEFMDNAVVGDDTTITLTIMQTIQAGYDVEDLNVIINLVPVASKALTIQLKGRLSRTFEGKELALYIALVDTGFFGIVNVQSKQLNVIEEEAKSKIILASNNIVFNK